MSKAQEFVAAGAALLDEKGPGGWRQDVLAGGRLDMYLDCVLDRVYGDYFTGTEALGLAGRQITGHGFCPGHEAGKHELADAWEAEARKGQS